MNENFPVYNMHVSVICHMTYYINYYWFMEYTSTLNDDTETN